MAWIFQPIKDIKQRTLYDDPSAPLKQRIAKYNEELRKNVEPELYVRYCIWQCDIYVDVTCITVATQNVYPDVSAASIMAWIDKHSEPHHHLVA